MVNEETVPLTVSPEVGGALVAPERGRGWAYQEVKRGSIPSLRFGRRVVVPIARLEALVGRRITVDDVRRAEAIVAARKPKA
jgi:hypothetical protein